MESAELKIIFSDDSTAPPAPPPAQVAPQQPGAPAPASSPQSTLPPDVGPRPNVSQYAGAVAQPSAAAVGPPASPAASTLTAAEARELFEKYGLQPSAVGMQVAPVVIAKSSQTAESTGRGAVDAVHSAVDPEALIRNYGVPNDRAAGRIADDVGAGAVALPPKPPKPSRKPADDETVSGAIKTAFGAAAEQGIGAVAGKFGEFAGPGAGAIASSLASSVGALAVSTGPAAVAVGGLAVAAGAGALALHTLADQADKLKNLSPEVANASAFNDVRQNLAMMRRAEVVGPQLASFERDRGDINAALTEQMTQIVRLLLQLYQVLDEAGLPEFVKDSIGFGTAQTEVMIEGVELLRAIRNSDLPGIVRQWFDLGNAQAKVSRAALEFFRKSEDDKMKAEDLTIGMLQEQMASINTGLERGAALAKIRKHIVEPARARR